MSTYSLARGPRGLLGAYESGGQIRFASLGASKLTPRAVSDEPREREEALGRKHPSIACGADGSVLVAWIEGMSWAQGGTLAWQLFGPDGKPLENERGRRDGVPAWSLVQAVALSGGFALLY